MKPSPDSPPSLTSELELPNPSWSMGDLIDYQVYLEEDHRASVRSEEDAKTRENILNALHVPANAQKQKLADGTATRRAIFKGWIQGKRQETATPSESQSVGEIAEQAANSLTWICILLAVIAAFGVAATVVGSFDSNAIATDERPYKPLDILHALAYGLLPQVLMILFSVLAFFARKASLSLPRPVQTLFFLALRIFTSLKAWASGHADVDGATRSIKAQLGKAVGRLISRREVFSAALLHRLQKVGWIYSMALVIFITGSFTINARSFGWQSSLNLTPETIHKVTQTMSVPWSFFAPEGYGSPSLEQVRQTEFSEIKGFSEVEKVASKPWIHFLLYSLLFYTVLPRFLLGLITKLWANSTLAKLDFSDVNDNTLFRRLKSQPFTFSAPVETEEPDDVLPFTPPSSPAPSTYKTEVAKNGAWVILTDTPALEVDAVATALEPQLQALHEWRIHHARRVYSVEEQTQVKDDFASLQWQDGRPRLVVVRRANHLVMSVKRLIQELLTLGGRQTQLVLLIGGAPQLLEDAVDPIHVEAWVRYADELKGSGYANVVVEVLHQNSLPPHDELV